MTVGIVINHERETLHLPVRERAVYPVEKRLLIQAGIPLPVRWVKVNDLSPLWPASHFREAMLAAATAWVSQMAKRGYALYGHEGDTMVCGPFKPKRWDRAVAADPYFQGLTDLQGHQTDTADFLLYANFLKDRGKIYAEDHEQMAATFGKDYDRAMTASGNNVLEAMLKLPRLQQTALARTLAAGMVEERERRAVAPYGS